MWPSDMGQPPSSERDKRFAVEVFHDPVLSNWLETLKRRTGGAATASEARTTVWPSRPTEVLGDQLVQVLRLMKTAGESPEDKRAGMFELARLVKDATPYLWRRDVVLTALSTPPPRHVVSREVLRDPLMWWAFEEPLVWVENGERHPERYSEGLLLRDLGTHFRFWFVGSTVELGRIEYGSVYPDADPENAAFFGNVLALLSFLNSPFIPKRTDRANRADRRRTPALESALVTFVDLRQPEASHPPASPGEGVRYQHRWVVRGHHRAQWYPSKGAHHVIWVAPYMKGPEGAPLKSTVYRVAR